MDPHPGSDAAPLISPGKTDSATPAATAEVEVANDFPTFGRLIEHSARDLLNQAEIAYKGVEAFNTNDTRPGTEQGGTTEANSTSEVEAVVSAYNTIAVQAFKLARHLRTLAELRDADVEAVSRALDTRR